MNSTECCNIEELLNTISYIQKRTDIYKVQKKALQEGIDLMKDDVEVLSQRKQLIESSKQYYLKVVDMCYMHSIKEMEDFVNFVLAYVFYDESYRIKLDITNRYNKSITFYVIDENRGLELPLRKGNGKGVKAVASFILLTYYLLRLKSPYLFLDESFVNISAGYVERFFEYVKRLCKEQNLCVVLITHDQRFPEYADKIYRVSKGEVECIRDDDK